MPRSSDRLSVTRCWRKPIPRHAAKSNPFGARHDQSAEVGCADGAGPLSPGTQLGPYRVEALLGAGGMGAVYKGTDVRLQRPVAVRSFRPIALPARHPGNDFCRKLAPLHL